MTALVLDVAFVALCGWYGWIVWMMLRDEPSGAMLALMCVVAFCAASHTVFTYDYPLGYYEDEIKDLYLAWDGLRGMRPLFSAGDGLGVSMAAYSMIQGVLWQVLPAWWAIRLHPMVCGVLVPIGAYAVARTMGCRAPGAVVAAVGASATPWALLYSRTSMGIEIVWHELIVLWLVAGTIWARGPQTRRWEIFTVLSVAFGLALLIYDYFAGRTVVYMMPLLALLAPGRRGKLIVLLGCGLGLLLYVPAMLYPSMWTYRGFGGSGTEAPLERWLPALQRAVVGFVEPITERGSKSLSKAAMMPVAAILASLSLLVQPWRRSAFLLIVFACGILPIAAGGHVSTHRMLACYVAVALGAGGFVDRVPTRVVQTVLAAAVGVVIAWQGTTTFFDPAFWTDNGGWSIVDCFAYQRPERPICYPGSR